MPRTRNLIALFCCVTMLAAVGSLPGPAAQQDGIAVYFTPGNQCTDAIVKEITGATKSVRVQAYSFTSAPIAETLRAAHQRGVEVTVLLDGSQRTAQYSKPEVLMPGGRQLYSERVGAAADPVEFELITSTLAPGQLVASPSAQAGNLSGAVHSCGTSNATALATRLAALVHENLEGILAAANPAPDRELLPVMVKALLVHASAWSDPDGFVEELTDAVLQWQEKRRLQAQLMGFGPVIPERALIANDQRVLLVGAGRLADGEAHRYTLPLPDLLSGQTWRRRLVGTVAWLSPLHFRHRKYRRAKLYLSADGVTDHFGATIEADDKLADHGTVQHLIREIQERRVIDDNAVLALQVNCKADAGELTDSVPYGFAVTLEVAAPVPVNIYEPIRDRLRLRVPVRPR